MVKDVTTLHASHVLQSSAFPCDRQRHSNNERYVSKRSQNPNCPSSSGVNILGRPFNTIPQWTWQFILCSGSIKWVAYRSASTFPLKSSYFRSWDFAALFSYYDGTTFFTISRRGSGTSFSSSGHIFR